MKLNQIDFAEQIRSAPDLETSWDLFFSKLNSHGIIHAKYGFLTAPRPHFRSQDILLVGGFCDEWENVQAGTNWLENDYVVEHVARNIGPLTFSRLYLLADNGQLTNKQAENHKMGREIGMAHGVALPLHDGNLISSGGISFEADRSFTEHEFKRHLEKVLPELQILSEVFHSNLVKPHLVDQSQLPSARERECLIWVSKGLRVQAIAEKIGSHPKTVEKQLANARKKMRAKTNSQAVIRALLLGFLEP